LTLPPGVSGSDTVVATMTMTTTPTLPTPPTLSPTTVLATSATFEALTPNQLDEALIGAMKWAYGR